jgi:hypothetical protein
MQKREVCVAAMFDHATFDKYWEGKELIENQNIGTFYRQSVIGMLAYGIVDRINFIAMAPHISTRSTGGQLAGVSGMQDLTLALKGKFLSVENDNSKLSGIGLVSYSFPLSNYLSDYMPYSIGLGTREFAIRTTFEYVVKNNWYARLSGAIMLRGYSEVERDFYYNNGAYYSRFMDVPNAINVHGALGYLNDSGKLRIELTYNGTKCLTGDDIRSWLRPQPTNKVMVDQIGTFIQYYFTNRISGVFYANQVLAGRNIGRFTNATIGVTYQFKI